MSPKRKRLILFGGAFVAAASAAALTLTALNSSITYFYTPSELSALEEQPSRAIRLGGLVAVDSIEYQKSGSGASIVSFTVTDGAAAMRVSYEGILPDLFREGQGVVVQGRILPGGHLNADNVLAKHDENYMPKEVADALKEQGRWQETPEN